MENEEHWEHLKPYGYAPGNYFSRCLDCKIWYTMDKRASRCKTCAEQAFKLEWGSESDTEGLLKPLPADAWLGDVDMEAWKTLQERRGGCRCFISPPCHACTEPLSDEELTSVGYFYQEE